MLPLLLLPLAAALSAGVIRVMEVGPATEQIEDPTAASEAVADDSRSSPTEAASVESENGPLLGLPADAQESVSLEEVFRASVLDGAEAVESTDSPSGDALPDGSLPPAGAPIELDEEFALVAQVATPVPEPGTLLLLSTGLTCLVGPAAIGDHGARISRRSRRS